jgi:hypothetical protein
MLCGYRDDARLSPAVACHVGKKEAVAAWLPIEIAAREVNAEGPQSGSLRLSAH